MSKAHEDLLVLQEGVESGVVQACCSSATANVR